MNWKKYVDILLLFAGYAATQPPIIPMEIETLDNGNGVQHDSVEPMDYECSSNLGAKGMEQAKDVCEERQTLANEVLGKYGDAKIVYLPENGKITRKDYKLLYSINNGVVVGNWTAKFVLLFQVEYSSLYTIKWFHVVHDLPLKDGKCFTAARVGWPRRLALRCGTPTDCLTIGPVKDFEISGFIFPEALLEDFPIDVIFPSLDMFRPGRPLFLGRPEANMKSFADKFGWDEQVPIKLAFIFVQETYGNETCDFHPLTFGSMAAYRANQIRRWLISLPGGEKTLTFSIPIQEEERPKRLAPASGNDKDTAVLLFGGDRLLIDYCILEHKWKDGKDDYMTEEQDSLKELRDDIRKWPKDTQKIVFALTKSGRSDVFGVFWSVFEHDIEHLELIELPPMGFDEDCVDCYEESAFVIIGFPKNQKRQMGTEDSESRTHPVVHSGTAPEDSSDFEASLGDFDSGTSPVDPSGTASEDSSDFEKNSDDSKH